MKAPLQELYLDSYIKNAMVSVQGGVQQGFLHEHATPEELWSVLNEG